MFKVIDCYGYIFDAYGTFIDSDGDIQFILCDACGHFYKTNARPDTIMLYKED